MLSNYELPSHMQERTLLEYESSNLATDYESLNKEILASSGTNKRDTRKMANKLTSMSGHASKIDTVDSRRDAEKQIVNTAARSRLEKDSCLEVIPGVRRSKTVSSNVRFLAEMIGVGPEAVKWDYKIASIPKMQLYKIVKLAREAVNPVSEWTRQMYDLDIRHPSCMRANKNEAYFGDSKRSPAPYGTKLPPKKNNLAASKEWMSLAMSHELSNRRTQCKLTGQSLIEHVKKGGLWQWRVIPDFHGMGIEAAREMINVAAIIAGIIPGEIKGEIPQIAKDLASDGNSWCGLALATKHRIFYSVAKSMANLQNSEFWNTDNDLNFSNLTDWHAATIASEVFRTTP